ncbi:unnamed protein product [Closterium sp. NIES-53]
MNGRGPLLAVILLLAHAVVTSQGAATAKAACMGSACTLQVSAALPPEHTLFLALNHLRYAAGAPPLCNSTVLRAVAREWLRNLWLAGLTPDCRNGSQGAGAATAGLGMETPECYQAPLLPHVRKEYTRYTPFITSLYSLFGTSNSSNLQSSLSSESAGAADEAARAFVQSTFSRLHSSSSSPPALIDYLISDVGIYLMEGSGIQEEPEPWEDERSTSTVSMHGGGSGSRNGLSSLPKGAEEERAGEHNWWVAVVVGQIGRGLQSFCEVRGQVVSIPGRAILV